MTYASRACFDADSHLMEPLDWLARYADGKIRDRLPPLRLAGAGSAAEKAIRAAMARVADKAASEAIARNVISGPKGWHAYGAFEPKERSAALDELGFRAQLVFSTFAATQFLYESDLDVVYGGARAHNRGISDFCAGDKRLIPVGIVPLTDARRALSAIKAAIKEGCGAIWIPAAPAGEVSPGHRRLDPVWEALEEAGVPFMLHIGLGTRVLPPAYTQNGLPRPKDWLGGGENLRFLDYMVLPHAPEMFLSALMLHGVFLRHRGLMGGVIELGGGWVPPYLKRLDLAHLFFRKSDPQVAAYDDDPASAVFRRHVKVTPFAGEDVGHLIREAGPDCFLFSSDYPHPEGGRDPIGRFESTMEGIGEAAKEKFYAANFAQMMGIARAA